MRRHIFTSLSFLKALVLIGIVLTVSTPQLAEAFRSLPSIFLRLLDNHLQGGL